MSFMYRDVVVVGVITKYANEWPYVPANENGDCN